MTDIRQHLSSRLFDRLSWRTRERLARWWRAWRYASNRLSADDAQDVIIDCRHAAGWYSLQTLSVDDTMDSALEEYQDQPALHSYIAAACGHVSRKWEPNSDERCSAMDWAIKLAGEWAAEDGTPLTPVTDTGPDGDAPPSL